MELIIVPKDSFTKKEKKDLTKIVLIAKNLLIKNEIPLPNKILFFNSFKEFNKKIITEVINYGTTKEIANNIINCALNNGTYGTIDLKENSIIEMNFNPFNKGNYPAKEFLELIIHETLHLQLSNYLKKDLNKMKFKIDNKLKLKPNKKIIQLDEGYAEFMTKKILKEIDLKKITQIKIKTKNTKKPSYKKEIKNFNIEEFDKTFEEKFLLNRKIGLKIFIKKFKNKTKNKEILNFTKKELKKFL